MYESYDLSVERAEDELLQIAELFRREKTQGKPIDRGVAEVPKGRYVNLALRHDSHFVPQNSAYAESSGTWSTSQNHKTEWERCHRVALNKSQSGDKDGALATNAFGATS